jgi:hypothetical protein
VADFRYLDQGYVAMQQCWFSTKSSIVLQDVIDIAGFQYTSAQAILARIMCDYGTSMLRLPTEGAAANWWICRWAEVQIIKRDKVCFPRFSCWS